MGVVVIAAGIVEQVLGFIIYYKWLVIGSIIAAMITPPIINKYENYYRNKVTKEEK